MLIKKHKNAFLVKIHPSRGLKSQTPDGVINSRSLHYQPEIFPSELSWVTTGSHLSYHILIHAIFFDFSRIHWAEFLSFLQYVFESILISNVIKVSYFKFKKENCLKTQNCPFRKKLPPPGFELATSGSHNIPSLSLQILSPSLT